MTKPTPLPAREFQSAVLASITTGILLVPDFSQLHEALEWIAGHPVWTHEIPSMRQTAVDTVLAIYPTMPTECGDDWQELALQVREQFGEMLSMPRGTGERTANPIETLEAVFAKENP